MMIEDAIFKMGGGYLNEDGHGQYKSEPSSIIITLIEGLIST